MAVAAVVVAGAAVVSAEVAVVASAAATAAGDPWAFPARLEVSPRRTTLISIADRLRPAASLARVSQDRIRSRAATERGTAEIYCANGYEGRNFGRFWPYGLWYGAYPFAYDAYDWGYPAYHDYGDYYAQPAYEAYTASPGYVSGGASEDVGDQAGQYVSDDISGATASEAATGDQFFNEALAAFRQRQYGEAARLGEHAAIEMPGDARVHALLAQSLLALNNYRGAAMEAHAASAGGTGIDWPTLYGFYNNLDTYTAQLRSLETYSRQNPNNADAHFLLGFEYKTLGHAEPARAIRRSGQDRAGRQAGSNVVGRQRADDCSSHHAEQIQQPGAPAGGSSPTAAPSKR